MSNKNTQKRFNDFVNSQKTLINLGTNKGYDLQIQSPTIYEEHQSSIR